MLLRILKDKTTRFACPANCWLSSKIRRNAGHKEGPKGGSMFLDDEEAYARLRRSETVMGWLAITAVAALVFMFAGFINAASATTPSANNSTLGLLVPKAANMSSRIIPSPAGPPSGTNIRILI
jgi:hypothetical protein